jgi:hypothetical protein
VKLLWKTTIPALLCALLAADPADAQCTGTGNTTITGTSVAGIGTLTWTTPNNIGALDGAYATAGISLTTGTTTTYYLEGTGLGFSIPVGNTVCGVAVTIQRLNTSTTLGVGVYDNTVSLINGGVVSGNNEANTSLSWPTTITAANYGGATDDWGLALTPAAVNAANFGAALAVDLKAPLVAVTFTAEVDQMTVTVYSEPPVLAITLQNFTVTAASGGGNLLSWEIPTGMAVNRLIIERSPNGQDFSPLDSINAGAQPGPYIYTDNHPLPGPNYYRLHLLAADGSIGYSVMAAIVTRVAGGVHIYPNPFHTDFDVNASTPFTRLTLRDLDGRVLFSKLYPGGVTGARVPATGVSQGLYILSVDTSTFRVLKN